LSVSELQDGILDLPIAFQDTFLFSSISPNPQLEAHLFHLSSIVLQAVPLAVRDKTRMLANGVGVIPMNSALKNGMFATATIFSVHPMLNATESPYNLRQRIYLAKKYASTSLKYVNEWLQQLHFATVQNVFSQPDDAPTHLVSELVDVPDLIRSMLSLAHFSYGIGEGGTSMKLIRNLKFIL
jgi:hypothetical protein